MFFGPSANAFSSAMTLTFAAALRLVFPFPSTFPKLSLGGRWRCFAIDFAHKHFTIIHERPLLFHVLVGKTAQTQNHAFNGLSGRRPSAEFDEHAARRAKAHTCGQART
jgi:hypothetical protein